MKKYIVVIIAAAFVLIGLIGALVCVIPTASAEFKTVDKFISAVDDCDYEAIVDCFPIEELSSVFGIESDDVLESSSEKLESKLDYLKAFGGKAAKNVPEDAKSVEKIELISCSKFQEQSVGFLEETEVECVIRVEYITADDEKISFTVNEEYDLMMVDGKYKIYD